MVGKGDFTVEVIEKEVVAAAVLLPKQEQYLLPMSNLDLLLPPMDLGFFFCYKKTPEEDTCSVLKKSLAQILVSHYPFAGEIVLNTVGEPEILCNNQGVDFIDALADVDLCDLDFYKPDESIESKFVPEKKKGVLRVQATKLQCGGLVLACIFDHRVADAYSVSMFLSSWAETARSIPLSLQPSFRRSLLSPRRPGIYSSGPNNLYIPISAIPPPLAPQHPLAADHIINRIYYIPADQLIRLQLLASASGAHKTKLETLSAFLWKLVAVAGVTGKWQFCKLGIVVDGRMRLSQGETDESKLFTSYVGNVLLLPYGERPIQVLTNQSLTSVADFVHEFLQAAVNKDPFLDLIDWVEAHRPEPILPRYFAAGKDGPNGPGLVVSSGQLFPMWKLDFGWGKPLFGSILSMQGSPPGYVMPMPSPVGNGDWIVYIRMKKGQVELIESEGVDVFKPLTFDYLNGN